MCMSIDSRIPVLNGPVEAFKVFSVHASGQLQSAFQVNYSPNLFYPTNKWCMVDFLTADFFAFKTFESALNIVLNPNRWVLVSKSSLMVLPVLLQNQVKTGTFHIKSNDSQTLDTYTKAHQAKEIFVRDSIENRNKFYEECVRAFIKNDYDVRKGTLLNKAFKHVLPELVSD